MVRSLERIAGATLALAVFVYIVPMLETKFYPVVIKQATITRIRTDHDGGSFVWGTSKKLRLCRFEYSRWYQGSRGGASVRVVMMIRERSKTRADGEFDWGPWHVKLDGDTVLQNSYADVWHQCFILGIPLPWMTRSEFY